MAFFYRDQLLERARRFEKVALKSADDILAEGVKAFSENDRFDVFLSHSYRDAEEIIGLQQTLQDYGFTVYVDWIVDRQLDRSKVTTETAELLRKRMRSCSSLLYVVSVNSPKSVWMPWELGYFDGLHGKVAVVPVAEWYVPDDDYKGQEYLGLYPYVTFDQTKWGRTITAWINHSPSVYVSLRGWLSGNPITQR
jgi:hypothetical protein